MNRGLYVQYSVLGLSILLVTGCGCFAGGRWHPFSARPAPSSAAPAPVAPAVPAVPAMSPVRPVEAPTTSPAPKPAPPAKLPKRAEPEPPAPSVEPATNDRAKKISSARGDLQTGMTALELRAVNVCVARGAACLENQGLMKRARGLDEQLAAALLDPQIAVDWPEVTTVLRAIVDSAMRPGAK